MAGRTTLTTTMPDGSDRRLLQAEGFVTGTRYSWCRPGGAEQLSATFLSPSSRRVKALDPGRRITGWRGLSQVWRGVLDEPVPVDGGWQFTAHGDGTLGADFRAYYSGTAEWTGRTAILTRAAARGLPWTIGSVTGYLDANPPDPATLTVTDYLNSLMTSPAAWWYISRTGALVIETIPTAVTRLLVAGSPPARTLSAGINSLYVKYTITQSSGGAATYGYTYCQNATLAAKHGVVEETLDVTGTPMSSAAAQAIGNDLLAKYIAAPWSSPVTARWGQLLNPGGVPCDPGCERAGGVYQLLVADSPFGGEVSQSPVIFPGGRTEYDDDAQAVTITPYLSWRTDFGSMIANLAARRRA